MGAVKNEYHDELESRRAIADDHCGQCGEDADLDTEAWTHGLCQGCFDEANDGLLGVGA